MCFVRISGPHVSIIRSSTIFNAVSYANREIKFTILSYGRGRARTGRTNAKVRRKFTVTLPYRRHRGTLKDSGATLSASEIRIIMSACLLRSVIRDFISSDKRIRRKRRKRKGGRGKKKRRRGRRRRRRRGGGGGGRRRRRRKETAQANISQPSRGDLCKEKSRLEFMMAGLLSPVDSEAVTHTHTHTHTQTRGSTYSPSGLPESAAR